MVYSPNFFGGCNQEVLGVVSPLTTAMSETRPKSFLPSNQISASGDYYMQLPFVKIQSLSSKTILYSVQL